MSSTYIRYPAGASGGVTDYANFAAFPASAADGALALALDTDVLYAYNVGSVSWVVIAGPGTVLTVGTIDSQTKSANGAVIAANTLVMQDGDSTHPGLISTGTQTIAGQKTFSTGLTGTLTGAASLNVLTSALSNLTDAGTDGIVVTGGTGAVVGAISLAQHVADTTHNGYLNSTDWNTFNGKQAALTIGNLTDAGTDGIVVTGGTGAVIGSGTSVAQHVADTTHNGYLSSTDWTTFNSKGSGTVTAVSVASANGLAGSSSGGATPALTLSTTITGMLKGNATAISAGTSGTDYSAGTNGLSTGILKSTTTTGALTIAVAGDFPTLNQNTSGSAASLSATLAIASGGTNVTSVTTAPAATAFAGWDANKNLSANNHIEGYATTATGAGTTTLTVSSAFLQYFTGSTTQTVKLPVVTTLVNGMSFQIINSSTGLVTVQSSGANTITTMVAASAAVFTVLDTTAGTGTASWSVFYVPSFLSTNTASTVVLRDGSGNFAAGTVTAAVTGTASGNTTYSANNHGVVISGAGNAMTVIAPDSSTTKVLTSGGSSADPTWAVAPGGAPTLTIQTKTTTYSAVAGEFVSVSASSGWTLTLPTAVGVSGQTITVKRTDNAPTNLITVNTTSGQTIDGASTVHLNTQNESWTFVSDNANWLVQDHKTGTTRLGGAGITITSSGGSAAKGTHSTDNIDYERIGIYARVHFTYVSTGAGTTGTGCTLITLPAGLTANTTIVPVNANTTFPTAVAVGNMMGEMWIENGSNVAWFTPVLHTSTTVHFAGSGNGAGGLVWGDGGTASMGLGNATLNFAGWFDVPISNWEA